VADRFWVGGSGNYSDATNHWATVSGGAPGAGNLPTSADNAIFDANSNATAYTVTQDATNPQVANVEFRAAPSASGTVTFAGSLGVLIFGNLLCLAGMVWTFSGRFTHSHTSGTKTITTNGVVMSGAFSFTGIGGTTQLADNLTCSGNSSGVLIKNGGGFDANGKKVTLTGSTTPGISGAFTFFDFERLGTAVKTCGFTLDADIVIAGTFKYLGNSIINRLSISSLTLGTPVTITAAAIDAASNFTDFMDITAAGAAAPFATGTSLGNCGGSSNITFTPAVTRYWVAFSGGNWSATTSWSASSGGASGASVPLCQDTVVINNLSITSSGRTITMDMPRTGGVTFAGVLNTPTVSFGVNPLSVFGSFTLDPNITQSFGSGAFSLSGRGNHTLTSAGKTIPILNINAPGGTYTLQDALAYSSSTSISAINKGTLVTNGFSVTVSLRQSVLNDSTLNMGASTFFITNTGTTFTANWVSSATATIIPGTSTIKFISGALAMQFQGNGLTFNNFWFSGTGSGPLQMTGLNTFNQLKVDPSLTLQLGNNSTVADLQMNGSTPTGADVRYARYFGISGGFWSAPDSIANSIVGDIDIRIKVAPDNWNSGSTQSFIAKRTGSHESWLFSCVGSGSILQFAWWDAGGVLRGGVNSDAHVLVNGVPVWVRVTLDVDNGSGGHDLKFYSSSDYDPATEAGTWNQIGATKNAGAFTTSIRDETAALEIGSQQGGTAPVSGRIFRAMLYNGIAGARVTDFNPALYAGAGAATINAATGEVYTRAGPAPIGATNLCMLGSTSSGNITITKSGGGHVQCEYVAIDRSVASPVSTFYAANSLNNGNSTNWIFGNFTYTLVADAGVFAFTGYAAGLYRNLLLHCAAGAYAVNGQPITMTPIMEDGRYVIHSKDRDFTIRRNPTP
jgi:hypothetical protein